MAPDNHYRTSDLNGEFAYPEFLMSKTHAGVCYDFSTVFEIMCCEYDIPCHRVYTDDHMWNVVYIDHQWIEIDLTTDVQKHTYSKDVYDVTIPGSYDPYRYKGFDTFYAQGVPTDID